MADLFANFLCLLKIMFFCRTNDKDFFVVNLKTFKDFSFMQNHGLLKTLNFFKDLNTNCGMMSLFSKTFKDLS